MKTAKKIGILGGMGPEASLNAYARLLKYCQHKYGSVQDYEYPQVILNSLQLFGFDETGFVDKDQVLAQLLRGVKLLENAGCDHLFIPCNTVHLLHNEMQSHVDIKILNILDETCETVLKADHQKVGILSSQSTKEMQLYQNTLTASGIDALCVSDHDQAALNEVIKAVMAGKQGEKEKEIINRISQKMMATGASAIILGCTELPLAISQKDCSFPLFDSLQIVTEKAVDMAFFYFIKEKITAKQLG